MGINIVSLCSLHIFEVDLLLLFICLIPHILKFLSLHYWLNFTNISDSDGEQKKDASQFLAGSLGRSWEFKLSNPTTSTDFFFKPLLALNSVKSDI